MPTTIDNHGDNNLTARVIRCIEETQHLGPGKVTLDSTFEELGIDSLAGINIAFAVENEFSITVPDEALPNIRTVRDLVEGVEKLAGGKAK